MTARPDCDQRGQPKAPEPATTSAHYGWSLHYWRRGRVRDAMAERSTLNVPAGAGRVRSKSSTLNSTGVSLRAPTARRPTVTQPSLEDNHVCWPAQSTCPPGGAMRYPMLRNNAPRPEIVFRAGSRPDSNREKIVPPAGFLPAGEPILKLSRLGNPPKSVPARKHYCVK